MARRGMKFSCLTEVNIYQRDVFGTLFESVRRQVEQSGLFRVFGVSLVGAQEHCPQTSSSEAPEHDLWRQWFHPSSNRTTVLASRFGSTPSRPRTDRVSSGV